MQRARMLGNYAQEAAKEKGLSIPAVSQILGCTEHQVLSFYKGRFFLSFPQISSLSDALGVSVEEMLRGNEEQYNKSVVDCMGEFDDIRNRENILDIIENYVDLLDSVNCAE